MVQFDWSVGAISKALKDLDLHENTILIVSSDNGPVYDDGYEDGSTVRKSTKEADQGHDGSGPYRGGKYQIYEGGTRVPFIVRWPKMIKPSVSSALVSQIDLIASFAKLLNVKLNKNEAPDSRNTLDAFLGKDKEGLEFTLQEANRTLALREGDWKFIPGKNNAQLYDLSTDSGESKNLITQKPALAKKLRQKLNKLKSESGLR